MTSVEKIPGTSKANGVIKADNEEVGSEILAEYADSIDLDPTLIAQETWNTTVRIACSSEKNKGIEAAKKALLADRLDINHDLAKQRRTARFAGDYHLIQNASNDDRANRIFDQCYSHAIEGVESQFTFGEVMTSTEIVAVRDGWDELGVEAANGSGSIHNFHSYAPQNKANEGKGNVGDTKEKRKLQADFLVYFGPRKINAHVNVKD